MSTCSFQTALDAWNEGFQGYFVDLTLTMDLFLGRLSSDSISPEHSFIAFIDHRPVGFLLNAFRTERGRKLAWIGGTGVAPEFRGKGIGRRLLEAAIDLYQAEGVNTALLEAISDNVPAISLYKQFGYEVVETLTILQTEEEIANFSVSNDYSVEDAELAEISNLDFYRELSPWQCQWQSLVRTHAGGCIVRDTHQAPVAYVLFSKRFDAAGRLVTVALCQCEVAPGHNEQAIVPYALQRVFLTVPGKYRRVTHDFRKSNSVVIELLINAGFKTFVEQVHMIKQVSGW